MNLKGLVITDQRLGEGGFGSVFVGQLGEKKVAVKKLSQSKKEFEDLSREASKLRRLRFGKYITYTYGIALREESLHIVMECSEHGDLQNYLENNRDSVIHEQKILFCRGILLGLLYCHSMKIFHGDIKCSNVLLGKNLEPKLTDFGLSMTVNNIAYYSKLYKGSLYWTAPELLSIEDETVYQEFIADPYLSDVYSLGATFCEISYDGTTDFIDSDDPGTDIMLGIVFPTSKDAFLEEIVDGCCQFERDERMSLDECLLTLSSVAEEQLLVLAINDKWQGIQQGIKASSRLELPPSFILYRPADNLVVGPSNLSLLEWLCISDNVEAVEYMIQLHNPKQKQLKWLYSISVLCKSPSTAEFLQSMLKSNTAMTLKLSDLIDTNSWQLIKAFVKAGANCSEKELLDKAVKGYHNKIVQLYIDNALSYKKAIIHNAAKFGNTEAVRILAGRIDLEFRDKNGDTPLLAAINTGNFEIVKVLLNHKVNVHNKGNYSQYTPLYRAAVKGNHEIVKLLINSGATIDIRSSEWHSLVQDLEQQGKGTIIQLISNAVKKRAKKVGKNHIIVTPVNNRGRNKRSAEPTPLCIAIRNRQSNFAQKLIYDGADANEYDYDKYSPLHWAAITGDEEIARTLLRAGADIDAKTPNQEQNLYSPSSSNYFNEYTSLHIAIVKRHLGIAKFLIESGANFSLKNKAGQTIMEMADNDDKSRIESIIQEYTPITEESFQWILETMSMEVVKTLISSRDASIDTLNRFLCITAYHGNTEAIYYLLEHGTRVNSKYKGKGPLEWAISGGHAQIVQILIDQGADIYGKGSKKHNSKSIIKVLKNLFSGKKSKANEVQNLSDPPLHQAAALNNVEIVEILLNSGVEIDARNDAGHNALYCAALCGCDEVVVLLYEKGAKVRLWKKAEDSDTMYETAKYIVHKAAETGKASTKRVFIDAGVIVDLENKSNYTPPLIAILNKKEVIVDSSPSNNAPSDANIDKITALTEAVRSNQLERVQSLLDAGADINAKNTYGRTPLIECVDESLVDMVQFLIKKGADVNARDKNGYAPIHHAKNKQIVEILITHGVDINAKSIYRVTLLVRCIKKSLVDIVQFLVEKGADINARNERGFAPIHHAKNKQIVEILITHGADINTKSANGRTPLIECVNKSLIDMVQFLIEKGADVNARNERGFAPIHYAKKKQIAEILIAHGVDVNAKNTNGVTPLIECVDKSLVDMVQFLIEKGADVNARNEHGFAPIHYAKKKQIVEILITHGADVNAKSANGRTPLIECVDKSLVDMVQFLIEKGADVNARNERGFAPIHYAKKKQIVEILITHGADVNTKSANGVTPLIECVDKSLVDMVQFLIEKGADVNARAERGYAPIHYAKNKQIVEILITYGADIKVKNNNGKILFNILLEKQNKNLDDTIYKRKEVSKLLDYLKNLK